MVKKSIYTTAYNIENLYDNNSLNLSFTNYSKFSDEIVVATHSYNKDKTIEILKSFQVNYPKIKIVIAPEALSNPKTDWDGKLKDFALKQCSNEVCIQMDIDELISCKKDIWEQFINDFSNSSYAAVMITSIDLFGDWDHYKSIGGKWYIHKKTGCNRGVVNFAKDPSFPGGFDPKKSDSCELIDDNGDLVNFADCRISLQDMMDGNPFIVHYGYVSLDHRVKINNEVWKDVWAFRHGGNNKIEEKIEDFSKTKNYSINFKLWT
jgi:hypothetical protein